MDATETAPAPWSDEQYEADVRRAWLNGSNAATGAALGWEKLANDAARHLHALPAFLMALPDADPAEWREDRLPSLSEEFAADIERRLRLVIRDARTLALIYRTAGERLHEALCHEAAQAIISAESQEN